MPVIIFITETATDDDAVCLQEDILNALAENAYSIDKKTKSAIME